MPGGRGKKRASRRSAQARFASVISQDRMRSICAATTSSTRVRGSTWSEASKSRFVWRAGGAEVAVFDREPVEGYVSVTGDIASSADVSAAEEAMSPVTET